MSDTDEQQAREAWRKESAAPSYHIGRVQFQSRLLEELDKRKIHYEKILKDYPLDTITAHSHSMLIQIIELVKIIKP